ncbi:MAG: tetratricopeptide repeat protein [Candidatus Protistobacter heckmanni]|nr:tetratricopeptide repeat protein [Candidatus Protistobacter heckmanni]
MAIDQRSRLLDEAAVAAQAKDLLHHALESNPGDPVPRLHNAVVLEHLGRLAEARREYDHLIGLDPVHAANAHLQFNRANVLKALGEHELAFEGYALALATDPGMIASWLNRGALFKALGRHEPALACYDELIARHPGLGLVHSARGTVLQGLDRSAEALLANERGAALEPGDARIHNNRGSALYAQQRWDEARAAFQCAAMLKPDYVEALCNRGLAEEGLGELGAARASYEQALAPRMADARWALGMLQLLHGEFDSGWEGYAQRWQAHAFGGKPLSSARLQWRPGLAAERLLIWGEQGVGDNLFFGGLLGEARACAAHLPMGELPRHLRPDLLPEWRAKPAGAAASAARQSNAKPDAGTACRPDANAGAPR